ncbi:hypothetical protein BX666DRAFT_1887197 [Dichotomocladium elegans]|nr:hypothetical protein BX666DRAFT_1887197 [Dichotomocladium elegans]
MSFATNNDRPLPTENTTIAMQDYWKSTIGVCEAALSLLRPLEHQNYVLVDAVTKPLRQLIGKGRDLALMKAYIPPELPAAPQQPWSNKARKTITLDFDPREHWDIVDTTTVYARLSNSSRIACKAVATIKQLDEVVEILNKSKCIAIDCEFLGLKNSPPELKVLQLAVSCELGFAILVDQVGLQICHDRLAPILESTDHLLIGWAFRSDAQAIEHAFPGIRLSRVVDLQEKLKAVAVEQLNLGTAMTRYAKDWPGLEEFSRAKQLGDTFHYLGNDCVWLRYPLPPEALVYAVFDVVSLIALHERTKQYPTAPQHYWPQTLISSLGPKALERWYRNRITHIPGNRESITLIDSPGKKGKKPGVVGTSASAAVPPPQFEDDDPRYLADMEEAIRRSKLDVTAKPSGEDRTVHQYDVGSTTASSPSAPASEAEATSTSTSIAPAAIAHLNMDLLNVKRKIMTTETVDYEFQSNTATNDLTFADDIHDDKIKKTNHAKIPEGTWDAPPSEHKEWDIVDAETAVDTSVPEPDTPGSSRHPLRNADRLMREHAGGEFAYVHEPEVQNWNTLAKKSQMSWAKGTDMDIDWENVESKSQEGDHSTFRPPPVPHMEPKKFHTSIHERRLGDWERPKHGEDNWNKEEARPTAMNMPLKGIPKIKYKAKGPKVVVPFDDGLESDESSTDEESDDDSTSKSDRETRTPPVEDTYRDDMYLDGGASIHVHLIKDASQLSTIPMPSRDEQLTAAVTFHVHMVYDREGVPRFSLKVVQMYLSTGDSYSILVNRVYRRDNNIENSAIGYILTSPNVRRITWGYHFVAHLVEEAFGFQSGPMIDLGVWMNDHSTQNMSFADAIHQEVKVEEDKQLYLQYLKNTENLQTSKFSSSIWDQERPSEKAIHFSALQGYMLSEVFLSVNAKDPDRASNYIWPSSTLEYQVDLEA